MVYDRYGPRVSLLTGVSLVVPGYLLMWLGSGGGHGVTAMALYCFMWNNGLAWFDTVAVATNIRNFSNDRGQITGLLKAFMGGSATLITLVYTCLYAGEGIELLLFLAVFASVVGLLALPVTQLVPPSQTKAMTPWERRVLMMSMLALCLLVLYIFAVELALELMPTGSSASVELTDVAVYVAVPILLMQLTLLLPWLRSRRPRASEEDILDEPLIKSDSALLRRADSSVGGTGAPGASLREILLDAHFWALTLIMLCGTGASLAFISNVAQQSRALAGADGSDGSKIATVVISVGNCIGRLVWGTCSDRFHSLGRVGWLTIATAGSTVGLCLAANARASWLNPCAALIGFTYGGYWAIVPGILADLWGTRWFAASYALVSLAPAFGSYLFSVELTGALYDRQAVNGVCEGRDCFFQAYMILGGICGLGTLVGVWLTVRTRVRLAVALSGSSNATL